MVLDRARLGELDLQQPHCYHEDKSLPEENPDSPEMEKSSQQWRLPPRMVKWVTTSSSST